MCRYIDALVNLMPQVLGLHDQLKKAAQDGDMETSHGICRIAVAMGETHSRYTQIHTGTHRKWISVIDLDHVVCV